MRQQSWVALPAPTEVLARLSRARLPILGVYGSPGMWLRLLESPRLSEWPAWEQGRVGRRGKGGCALGWGEGDLQGWTLWSWACNNPDSGPCLGLV